MATIKYLDPLAIIREHESNGDYNVFYGGEQIPVGTMLDQYGFPQWSGKEGPAGISHAAGAYQFEPATWAAYALRLGVKDFSPRSQDAVAAACWGLEGFAPWAPYNPPLAAAITAAGGCNVFSLGATVLALQTPETPPAPSVEPVTVGVSVKDAAGNPLKATLAAAAVIVAAIVSLVPRSLDADGYQAITVSHRETFWEANPPTFRIEPAKDGGLTAVKIQE